MPIYKIRCVECGRGDEVFRKVADYNDLPMCCGKIMGRVIVPPMVANDIQPYRSMIDGRIINSRSEHRAHLQAHGCIEVGNEQQSTPRPMSAPPGLKETLIGVANEKLRG